jgi:hypothetical protein
MAPVYNPRARVIRSYIEQLYENENLTSSLTDSSAKILLSWAENQLLNHENADVTAEELEEIASKLNRLVRYINIIIKKLPDIEEQDLVQRLLYLAERAQEYEKVKVRDDGEEDNQEINQTDPIIQ